MATTYRYLFADLLTNNIIAELPLTDVSFTQQLNQAGTFQGSILLSGINTDAYNAINGTIPGKTGIYVDRNGTLIWGGVIWGRPYSSDSQKLTINAREFESYFERRLINTTTSFTNQDQLGIAQNLITLAQSAPYGNIGVQVGTETSGVLLSRTYYGYEKKQVYQAIQDLARQLDGFDFNIQVAYNGSGNPSKTLRLGYPRLGTPYSSSNPSAPVFELPASNIVNYDLSEDGSITANTVYTLGAGSNEGKLIQSASDSTKFADGWPLLETAINYSEITDSTYLAQLASGQVQAISNPVTIYKVIVPAYEQPEFGTYAIGDDARLRITDARYPTTLDTVLRIVGITVEPGEDGPERVTLTLTNTSN
jgi:hypothetical protein